MGYARFMAIPNYTYLKVKIPGPKGVITVSSSYEQAYECNVECVEYEEAIMSSAKLAWRLEALAVEAQSLSAIQAASCQQRPRRKSRSTPTAVTTRC